MEERSEVCLQEEVEKMRRLGMSVEEISGKMGVDPNWVEGLVAMSEGRAEAEHQED